MVETLQTFRSISESTLSRMFAAVRHIRQGYTWLIGLLHTYFLKSHGNGSTENKETDQMRTQITKVSPFQVEH